MAQLSEMKGVTLDRSHASLGPLNRVLVIKISKADVLRTCRVPGFVPTSHTFVSTPTRWMSHYFYPPLDVGENKPGAQKHLLDLFTVNEGQPWFHIPTCPGNTGGFFGVGDQRAQEATWVAELNQDHRIRWI